MIYQYAACTIANLRSSSDQAFLNSTVPEIILPTVHKVMGVSDFD
jgi:hypothetical protein